MESLISAFDAAMQEKDYVNAASASQKMREYFPNDYAGWFRLASVWMALGENDKALDAASQSVELDPDNTQAWLVFGEILMRKEDYRQALEICAEIRSRFPDRIDGYLRAAEILRKLNEPEKAEEALAQGIERMPSDISLWKSCWDIAMGRKDYVAAFDRSLALIKKFQKSIAGYYRAAKTCLEKTEYEQADFWCSEV